MKHLKKVLFYNPEEDGRVYLVLQWVLSMAFLTVWSLGLGVLGMYFGKVSYGPELFDSYFAIPGLFWLNTLPVLLLSLLLLVIFNRVWPAVLGSGVIALVLSLINYFKLSFRNDPLLAGDIRFFTEAAQISSRYNVVITPAMYLCFAVVLAAAVFAFFLLRARFRRALPRIITAAVLLAAGTALYLGPYTSQTVYNKTANLNVVFENGYKLSPWSDTDRYCSHGFLYPLIHSAQTAAVPVPAGYSAEKARAALAEHEDAEIPAEKKINFVSIMLEAYDDFSLYGDRFSFEKDPYEFFHQLQAESCHGDLVTNIFAGNTIDTERCYITGAAEMYEYRGAAWSYARYFREQGYFTEFCHPSYAWFYNRQNVMEYLGFERCWFYENRYNWLPKEWGIMGDNYFFPDLIKLFDEATEGDTPYFNFSVTYQNHGPYKRDALEDDTQIFLSHEGISEESFFILNNYFWGLWRTDNMFRELVGHFRETEEPVVLVLFGDHKPWLGDNNSVYSELGFDLSRSTEQSFYDYYSTQYTIWANPAAREILGDRYVPGKAETLSPGFLMMKVMDLCGFDGPSYTQSQRELFPAVSVINSDGRFVENGVLTETLSPETREKLDKLLWMQYYYMHDWAKEAA